MIRILCISKRDLKALFIYLFLNIALMFDWICQALKQAAYHKAEGQS